MTGDLGREPCKLGGHCPHGLRDRGAGPAEQRHVGLGAHALWCSACLKRGNTTVMWCCRCLNVLVYPPGVEVEENCHGVPVPRLLMVHSSARPDPLAWCTCSRTA